MDLALGAQGDNFWTRDNNFGPPLLPSMRPDSNNLLFAGAETSSDEIARTVGCNERMRLRERKRQRALACGLRLCRGRYAQESTFASVCVCLCVACIRRLLSNKPETSSLTALRVARAIDRTHSIQSSRN